MYKISGTGQLDMNCFPNFSQSFNNGDFIYCTSYAIADLHPKTEAWWSTIFLFLMSGASSRTI